MNSHLYCMPEFIREKEYIEATYYIRLKRKEDIMRKAESMAIGQTIGTWVEVPGMTRAFKDTYAAKVIRIYDVPSCELEVQIEADYRDYVVSIAFPCVQFNGSIPLLLTSLLGNDASTSMQVKLLDINFSKGFPGDQAGPVWSIQNLRARLGVTDRPLLLSMIKPCTGLSPKEGAAIFYETACGGADIIKDDELLGNPLYSHPGERVIEYKKASDRAYEKTGKKTMYFVNITGEIEQMERMAEEAVENGADGIMVNFIMTGYGVLRKLRKKIRLPILAHCAGIGMYSEGATGGMVSPIALGKLVRLCGADMVMLNTPYGGYPLTRDRYMQTLYNLGLPFYKIKPCIPVIGGGVHPGMVETYVKETGKDIILAAGGAVHGHPGGSRAGAKAMIQAIEGITAGISPQEKARECEELSEALRIWGTQR